MRFVREPQCSFVAALYRNEGVQFGDLTPAVEVYGLKHPIPVTKSTNTYAEQRSWQKQIDSTLNLGLSPELASSQVAPIAVMTACRPKQTSAYKQRFDFAYYLVLPSRPVRRQYGRSSCYRQYGRAMKEERSMFMLILMCG